MNRLKRFLMDVPVPGAWNELSQAQFLGIAKALYLYSDKVELRTRITWRLLDLGLRKPRRLAAVLFGLSPLDRHQLTALADPFLTPEKLTGTPLQTLNAGGTVLHIAHTDLLEQVDAYVWGTVDAAYMRYNATKDVELLRTMACALYAPKGATRADRLNAVHAKLFDKVSMDELMALHLMWSGQRMSLVAHAPWVFRAKNEKKAARRKFGWSDVLLSIAGTKFGPYNDTCMVPSKVFLRELSHRIEQETNLKNQREAAQQRRRA